MYNVTMRRIRESFLPRKSNKYYIFVCARALSRACVGPGAWAWACACACLQILLLIQHATRMRHIVMSFVDPLATQYFLTLSYKRHYFGEKRVF